MSPTSGNARLTLPACALLLLASCGSQEAPAPAELAGWTPPLDANLVVISIDTTRADHLGCFGYDGPISPKIDRFARRSTRFTRAFTVMPTTLPAHTSLFTSQYPRQTGVSSNLGNVSEQEVTLAEHFQAAGIRTAGFSSASVLAAGTGIEQGFDEYQCPTDRTWPANRTCNMAREWIKANQDSRYFCFVHLYDPHALYDAPEGYRKKFQVEADGPLPPLEQLAFMAEPDGLSQELVDDAARAYAAEVAFVDSQIGALVNMLVQSGEIDKTIIVITSDHGETLNELAEDYNYAYDHGEFLYTRELQIPLLIRVPSAFKIPINQAVPDAVSLLDLMPTLLELMGLPQPSGLEGRSLVGRMRGEELSPTVIVAQRHAYKNPPNAWMEGEAFALVSSPWLLLASEGRGTELFNLNRDPGGLEDIAEANSGQVTKLKQRLAQWLETRRPKDTRVAPEAPGSERDAAMSALGYTEGG